MRVLKRWLKWVQRHPLYTALAVGALFLATFDGVMGGLERLVGAVDALGQVVAFLRTVDENVWAAIAGGLVAFGLVQFTRDRSRYERRIAALNRRARNLEGKLEEQTARADAQDEELDRVSTTAHRAWVNQVRFQQQQERLQKEQKREADRQRWRNRQGPTIG